MPDDVLLLLAFIGAIGLALGLAFFAFYRYLPSTVVVIDAMTAAEVVRGNATLVTVFVTYLLNGRRKTAEIPLSAYRSQIEKARQNAEQIREYYSSRPVRYYHLPILQSVGLLERPMMYPEVLLLGLILGIYIAVLVLVWIY